MPDAGYRDGVERCIELIEREVTGGAVANHQLAQLSADAPPYPWMRGENIDGSADLGKRGRGRLRRRVFNQEIHDALKVAERRRRIDYLRQRTALGRCALRPRILASRYACTSLAS